VCPAPHSQPPPMVFLNPPTHDGQYSHLGTNQKKPNSQCSTNEQTHPQDERPWHEPVWTPPPHAGEPDKSRDQGQSMLLRKEVIQPHLPVRLPCYDFVPIAGPTFDGSPHKGWATGFGCCRLS
jgi:hypothetical protein